MEVCPETLVGAIVSDVPGTQHERTASHLISTISNEAGHVKRHLESARQPDITPEGLAHDLRHAANHTDGVIEHARKLADVLAKNPSIAAESVKLAEVTRSVAAQRSYDETRAKLTADLLGTSK